MVGGKRADRTIVMGNSIRMVMKCKSQDGERKANDQEIDKFPIHQPIDLLRVLKSKPRLKMLTGLTRPSIRN